MRVSCRALSAQGIQLRTDHGKLGFGGLPPVRDDLGRSPELEHPELAQVWSDEQISLASAHVPELVLHDLKRTYHDVEAVR